MARVGGVAPLTVLIAIAFVCLATLASAEDEIDAFRVYSWSTLVSPHQDTAANCRAIDKSKREIGWAKPRREVVDVSDLELPESQEQGTAYRVFVDYCVRLDGDKERPVGAMTFRAAPAKDLPNVRTWGNRHYKATTKVSRKSPRPGREHFDPPNFDRPR
jgi:hypothetical protein